jgi:hypothetical protein
MSLLDELKGHARAATAFGGGDPCIPRPLLGRAIEALALAERLMRASDVAASEHGQRQSVAQRMGTRKLREALGL